MPLRLPGHWQGRDSLSPECSDENAPYLTRRALRPSPGSIGWVWRLWSGGISGRYSTAATHFQPLHYCLILFDNLNWCYGAAVYLPFLCAKLFLLIFNIFIAVIALHYMRDYRISCLIWSWSLSSHYAFRLPLCRRPRAELFSIRCLPGTRISFSNTSRLNAVTTLHVFT